jgi:hypothetical protein
MNPEHSAPGDPLAPLNEAERNILWTSAAPWAQFIHGGSYTDEHKHRFELYGGEHPTAEQWGDAHAYWTGEHAAEAALLLASHRARGHQAVLLRDVRDTPEDFGSWVVVSMLQPAATTRG